MQQATQRAGDELAPWMKVANEHLGKAELDSAGELNPWVRDLFHATRYPMEMVGKTTPWCGAFASTCLISVGVASPRSARALDFLHYGVGLLKPVYGCLLIFKRDDGSGKDRAHVGFLDKVPSVWPAPALDCLAGNQANQVCVRRKNVNTLLGMRWPPNWPLPPGSVSVP